MISFRGSVELPVARVRVDFSVEADGGDRVHLYAHQSGNPETGGCFVEDLLPVAAALEGLQAGEWADDHGWSSDGLGRLELEPQEGGVMMWVTFEGNGAGYRLAPDEARHLAGALRTFHASLPADRQ